MRVDNVRDDDLFVVEQPVQFAFAGPGPFVVAPTRFVALNITAALVIAIESGTHLEYLAAENALALADELTTRIVQAGWMVDGAEPNLTGHAELGLRLRDPAGPEVRSWYLGAWAHGDARLLLRLRRAHRRGRMADHDLFLLNLQWRDDSLARRADEIAMELRRADGQPAERARAIDLAAYVARVRRVVRR